MSPQRPVIGVLDVTGDSAAPVSALIDFLGGEPVSCDSAGSGGRWNGLCVVGGASFVGFEKSNDLPIQDALRMGTPLLAIESGFHALNLALGGGSPVATPAHCGAAGDLIRDRMFVALGSKLADTIGGAGFVSARACHPEGIARSALAPGTLASAYSADDGVVEAIEVPRKRWVIGVQWRAIAIEEQPSGFDNLFHALIGHARGS